MFSIPLLPVIGEDADGYWGLKGRETDEVSWWAGDDCVDGACSGQSRMPYRNGCAIDGYDLKSPVKSPTRKSHTRVDIY